MLPGRPSFRAVFARHWRRYKRKFGSRIPPAHRAAARAILSCRTPALGGHRFACDHCGDTHDRFHSCNHRLCPICGAREAAAWAERQRARLLPLPYRMITFTIPEGLRRVFRSHQRIGYAMLFRCGAETLQAVGGEAKYLGGRLGMLGVLHTWTRKLTCHPHIHWLVAEGGIDTQGNWHRARHPHYFLPHKRLSIDLRIRMQRRMRQEHPELYARIDAAVWREAWVCHIGQNGSGSAAVHYLAAYVCKAAMSKDRIVSDDGEHVTIEYTDSASGKKRVLRLSGEEFIRRFLQHVLPKGFKRVRAYGWLAPAAKKTFVRICAILAHTPAERPVREPVGPPECERCRLKMTPLGKLARGPPRWRLNQEVA